jgi:hypothetical protein
MKRNIKPIAASFEFVALKVAAKKKKRTVALVNDFSDEKDHQGMERIGQIQRNRSVRAKRAMFDN